ncbi:MAG: hypothetical protein JNM00_12665, partial [Flavobacteriales bacterium]|nr:hypothetical protein [Flavobacteriales bacterium]
MSRHLLTLLIPALLLASCTYQRPVGSTVAATEEDDYYTSTELEQRRSAWLRECPDYFENRFMPGTFNQLYNPYSWNNPVCANSFLNSGFNNFQPGWYLTWHPAYGWHFAWVSGYMPMNWGNFASTGGWYSGWNNYCNWGWAYDPFNTWSSGYDPWFDPYCYNYSGYNYGYSPWDYCGGDSYYWINNYYT